MIYLKIDEKKNCTLAKVGYTTHYKERMTAYNCYNPMAETLDVMKTYHKSGRKLEQATHSEMEKMGFIPVTSRGEWYIVPTELVEPLKAQGLKLFKTCKDRKSIKV